MKKLLTVFLSFAMVLSNLTITFAKEEIKQDPIYYVCMGDSVSAGYNLPGTEAVITENTINNYKNDPVNCYAHIVGEALKEAQGYNGDVYDTFSNISSAGGKLQDYIKLINDPEYFIYNMLYMGLGYTPEDLKYHDVYIEEISKADIISFQCGNNDLLTDMLVYMGAEMKQPDANPIVKVIYNLVVKMSVGATDDFSVIVDNMVATITEGVNSGEITLATIREAIEYLSYDHISELMIGFAKNAEADYPEFLETLQSVNNEAELIAVSFYGAFGNSLYCQESLQNLASGISDVFKAAITSMIMGGEFDAQSAMASVLLSAVSYPTIYLTMGRAVNAGIDELNSYLEGFCQENDITYVDVTDIPNEDNLDPHPDEGGHAYIAEQIINTLINNATITVEGSEEVTVSGNDKVIYGQDMTYTINGLARDEAATVTVNGKEVEVVDNAFVVNAKEDANIVVTVSQIPLPFTDVPKDKWYYEYVKGVYELGLMTGKTKTTFGPTDNITRGQLATILYRMAGSPEVESNESFEDVAADKFYTTAIAWCKEQGVVHGYNDGTFKPTNNITRQELAIMLRNYASYSGKDVSANLTVLDAYPDASTVSNYAKESVAWAVANGLISGTNGNLNPKGNATRGQTAKMILATYNLLEG